MDAASSRPTSTDVYVCRDKTNAVLYVGISSDLKQRKRQHRTRSAWWSPEVIMEVESTHFTRKDAAQRERELINKMAPLHNKAHRNSSAALARAQEQWLELPYDDRSVDVIELLASASTIADLWKCQRLAERIVAQRRPSAEEIERKAERRRQVQEAEAQRKAEADAAAQAKWYVSWQTVHDIAALGPVYSEREMLRALKRGLLEGEKDDNGVWWTSHDRVLMWMALTSTSN